MRRRYWTAAGLTSPSVELVNTREGVVNEPVDVWFAFSADEYGHWSVFAVVEVVDQHDPQGGFPAHALRSQLSL